jgi:ribosome-associated toxin RatA of RatAB toxin-antitoxin module
VKQLAATAAGNVAAPIERCYALVADVGSYPEWFPDGVRAAEVLKRDPDSGEPRELMGRSNGTFTCS